MCSCGAKDTLRNDKKNMFSIFILRQNSCTLLNIEQLNTDKKTE